MDLSVVRKYVKERFTYKGFTYRVDRKLGSTSYWRCVEKGCKGRIVTANREIESEPSGHFHIRNLWKPETAADGRKNGNPAIPVSFFCPFPDLEILELHGHWSVDVFERSPFNVSTTLCTISVVACDIVVPTIYALLPRDNRATYKTLFNAVTNARPALSPDTVTTDFETGCLTALKQVLPNAHRSVSYFLFADRVRQKILDIDGLAARCIMDREFSARLRMLCALAFVPPEHVADAYRKLAESPFFVHNAAALAPLMKYFEKTWVGRRIKKTGRIIPPAFEIQLWNCYAKAKSGAMAINNVLENWHKGFSCFLVTFQPCVWNLTGAIREKNSDGDIGFLQYINGSQDSMRKQLGVDVEALRLHANNYDENDKITFLKIIANVLP